MIKFCWFVGENNETKEPVLGIGLSAGNWAKLMEGKPIGSAELFEQEATSVHDIQLARKFREVCR